MDPAPFLQFERAQEIMDAQPPISYEGALMLANLELTKDKT